MCMISLFSDIVGDIIEVFPWPRWVLQEIHQRFFEDLQTFMFVATKGQGLCV